MRGARLTLWPLVGSALLLALACHTPLHAQEGAAAPVTLSVGAGDTATALALKVRPPSATLEQTLVALWRANPRAFGQGNLNQLLEGATLKVPSAQEILRIPAAQAHEQVIEQVEHFRAYARQHGKTGGASSAPAADPAPWARALAEAQALKEALERQNRDTQARLEQLEKNIQTLQNLQPAAAASSEAAPPAPSASTEMAASAPSPAASLPAPEAAMGASAAPQTSADTPPAVLSVPLEALWGGVVLVVALVWLLSRRRSPTPPTSATASTEIPPQMARISLELDAPSSSDTARQDPRP